MVERGKPAEYGQEITRRRARLTRSRIPLKGMTILDFGCGNGAQACEFEQDGCRVIGVDIDRDDLATFADQIVLLGSKSMVPIWYDGSQLPMGDGCIDGVISYEVLEHVQDEDRALSEISRVLKPGGNLVISVPNKWWVFETHGAYLPVLPWNRVPFFSWLPGAIHDRFAKARIYRKADITKLLVQHGFEIVEVSYITAPMDVVKNPGLKKVLRSTVFRGDVTAVPFFSTAILVHARKPGS